MIKVGDSVICTNDKFSSEHTMPNKPKVNREYTVREIMEHIGLNRKNNIGIRLVEITNPPIVHHMGLGMIEPSFNILRFIKKEDYEIAKEEIKEQELELIED